MRFILPLLLMSALPLAALGSARTVAVTKDNQKKEGVDLTLTAERHPDPTMDTVWVKVTAPKKGKLERLSEILLQIKDGDVLTQRVPLAVKQEDGALVGSFHMTPAQAKKCLIQLVCPTPVRTSVVTYEVRLATYLGK